jgi:hypothetical protein
MTYPVAAVERADGTRGDSSGVEWTAVVVAGGRGAGRQSAHGAAAALAV